MPLPVHRKKPCRSKNIKVKKNYRAYKEQLRNDFNHACGYCGDDDSWLGGKRSYHIDHFAPKKFKRLKNKYNNLVYSCPFCNEFKSNDWPSEHAHENIIKDEGYIDPCCDDFDKHLRRDITGKIIAKSNIGKYMHKNLKLSYIRHELVWKLTELQSLISEMRELDINDKPEYLFLLEEFYTFTQLLRNV